MAQAGADLIPEPSASDHVRGSLEAPVVLTEFGDFECSFCGDAFHVVEALREKYGPRVAFVFRHFPLSMHPHAPAAAEAAEAAASVGKFWEMHDRLFRNQEALAQRHLLAYAEAIGVDADLVEDAIVHRKHRKIIDRGLKSGQQSGIEGTPAFFIDGYAYAGEASVEGLSEAIDLALSAISGARV